MKRFSIVAALVAIVGPARAQNTSDLMPPPPQPPKGGGGYYYPGMPAPAAPDSAAGSGGVRSGPVGEKGDKGKEAPSGLYLYDEEEAGGEPEVSTGGPPPETYVVRKGDTLWGISSTYFRNPWAWPQLWSFNPSITNPHWIYPGDVLRLTQPGHEPPAALPTPMPIAQPHKLGVPPPPPPGAIYFRSTGFIEAKELKDSGEIVGSKEERLLLATPDEAYVEFRESAPLEVGGRYTVYKPIRKVHHPVSGEYLGEMVQIFGEVEVLSKTPGRIAKIKIVDVNEGIDGIQRGYRVGPLKRVLVWPQPAPSNQDLAGVVVTQLQPRDLLGAWTLAFIDRGKRDNVQVGNRFLIVRRGDGYEEKLTAHGPADEPRYPREDYGEVLVLEVRDRLSTCLVLRTAKELHDGDRVEAHKGY
ncbi:MAG TPA: LysM domain-containing protein [Polyangia bacterium]|nr:LysM domain-containing protein [Polyangia bacterium]